MDRKKIYMEYETLKQFMAVLAGDADALAELQRQQATPGTRVHTLTEHFNLRHAILEAQSTGEITADLVRRLFHYDPSTGLFTRKLLSANWHADSKVGTALKDGHIRMLVGKKCYLAHRLAFLYMTGKMPGNIVDHINGNPADNRFCNLREADALANSQNRRKVCRNNKSGFLGVHFNEASGKYIAQIKMNYKTIILGKFDDPKEAHLTYLEAKRKMHKGNTL